MFVGLDGREAAVDHKGRLKSTRPYLKRARSVSRLVIGIRPATRPNIHGSLRDIKNPFQQDVRYVDSCWHRNADSAC